MIFFVTMSLDVGGTERHLSLIAPQLKRLGWTPVIYCLWRKGQFASALQAAGIEVIGPDGGGDQRWSALRRAPLLALSWMRLLALVVRRKPQIMHFYLPLAYILGAPAAMLLRVPVRIMSRRSLNLYQQKSPATGRIERWLHARMTALLANSERVARDLIDYEGCPPCKVGLIYNGTDLSALAPAKTAPVSDIDGKPLTLIVVANLIGYKGHADLLDALAIVSAQMPARWRLLCVGRDQGCLKQLEEQGARLGLGDNVRFFGERSDVADLLRTADIGILSSHEEGFSNAVIEGMAAGLPMVVTDVGGNAEAVIDGEIGLVVPPHDPRALGAAIVELASNPDLRSGMGAAARARAVQEFSIEGCVEKYDRLYRGLLDGKSVGDIEGVGMTDQA